MKLGIYSLLVSLGKAIVGILKRPGLWASAITHPNVGISSKVSSSGSWYLNTSLQLRLFVLHLLLVTTSCDPFLRVTPYHLWIAYSFWQFMAWWNVLEYARMVCVVFARVAIQLDDVFNIVTFPDLFDDSTDIILSRYIWEVVRCYSRWLYVGDRFDLFCSSAWQVAVWVFIGMQRTFGTVVGYQARSLSSSILIVLGCSSVMQYERNAHVINFLLVSVVIGSSLNDAYAAWGGWSSKSCCTVVNVSTS